MKNVLRLVGLAGFGLCAAVACGSDNGPSAPTKAASKGGSAGTGGSSAGHSGQSVAGRSSATGGMGEQSGAGGGGGHAGSARGGSSGSVSAGSGGKGGSAGHLPGSGGSDAAGAGADAGGHDAGGSAGAPACVAATAKDWIDVSEPPFVGVVGSYATWLKSSDLASDSLIRLAILLPDTGSFTLGTAEDVNLGTCDRCLYAAVPVDGGADREFFADAGTLYIDPSSDAIHGVIHAELSNVHLAEITVDEDTGVSAPVDGGACVTLESSHLDFPPPDGAGGAGGAGGAAGAGGEGGAAGAPPIPADCPEITAGDFVAVVKPSFGGYLAYVSPNLGTPQNDIIGLELYTNDVGAFTFGEGVNSSYETCDQCFLVNVPDGTYYGRNFYAYYGALAIGASSVPRSGTLDATATDVTFLEVDSSLRLMPGGACLHLASASISLP